MTAHPIHLPSPRPLVVGSFGEARSLADSDPQRLAAACDLAEIRLDLFHRETAAQGRSLWARLHPVPLLFTARRHSEGSPHDLDAATRSDLLELALPDAALIDIEVASIGEMAPLIERLGNLPWIASYHDFARFPSIETLQEKAALAREAGAAAFKLAARLLQVEDLASLARFQLTDHGIPLVTMGMGPLAPVSRLLCAQAGSSLNYGYLGERATAPGQWSAALLKSAIAALEPLS